MRRIIGSILLLFTLTVAQAQVLSLDSARALALRNNKELTISRLKQDVARYNRQAARTNYLPKVEAIGGYLYSNKELALLSDAQKGTLGNLGTIAGQQLMENLPSAVTTMMQTGLINMQQAQALNQIAAQSGPAFQQALNGLGQSLADASRTDTRHMWGGSIMMTQPLFMGGKIIAYNKITNAAERLAQSATEAEEQNTIYNTDQAYWLVVSLKHKQRLAQAFYDLVKTLDDDVQKMIREGVATKADGLSVSVKVNEAEMALLQVEDGLTLAKMALCQQCGLPLDGTLTLADEDKQDIYPTTVNAIADEDIALQNRPELKMLTEAIEMNKQNIRLTRADFLPTLALMGGYTATNPSVFNGFEKKLLGMWNVGLILKVPVWNWFEGLYKVRSARTNTEMARYQLEDAREKIRLQVNQSAFQVNEASKRLEMAKKNISHAEENLRSANLGFKEGVIPTSDVLAAQTAWMQAQSQKIDAEINAKLSEVNWQKVLGTLSIEH
ncbi:MAG: TolC family protein [Bacteroidales bacterium]|nr:TolC family protein [Bacteroidales bacterium]